MKQGLHEISSVKMYPFGKKYRTEDQIYRYSYAGHALGGGSGVARLVFNSNWAPDASGHEDEDGFDGDLTIKAPIGQMYVDVPDTIARAKDYYQGGYLVIKAASRAIWHQHCIIASDVGDGAVVRCWLSKPIEVADAEVDDDIYVWRSPYSACEMAALVGGPGVGTNFESFVGLPLRPVTAEHYFWLLTAGPAFVQGGAVYPGSAFYLRDVYADPNDGTIRPDLIEEGKPFQRVGYVLPVTEGTHDSCTWIMLQLDQ